MIESLPASTRGALLRIARKIEEGFEGQITLEVKRKGVASLRWVTVENGDTLKGEFDAHRTGG